MTDGVRRRGISILATFARGGSHAIFLAIVAMTSVPAVAVHIAGVRAGKYAGHQQPASLTWQEIVGLVCSSVLALGFSVLGGAQLKAWIRPAVTLWRPAMTEAWILLFFLLATLELRALALDVGVLPAPIGGPLIAAMTIWVFLIGYLAKIPWDRLVEIVGERIAAISHDTH